MSGPLDYAQLDPIAMPLAGAVLEALLDAYDRVEALDNPCAAGLVAGAGMAADHCCASESADGSPCEGQLTVRVADVYPCGASFPDRRQDAMPHGGSGWVVELEVGVLRCALAMDEQGNPPTMGEQMASANRALADAGLVRHALTAYAVSNDMAHVFGALNPLGPEGGCVGFALSCTFLVE